MKRFTRVAAVLVLAATTGACAALFGFERLEEATPPADGGGPPDADVDATEAGALPCGDAGYPPRPAALGDAGPGVDVSLVVAANAFGFGDDNDPPGFNLDRACTTGKATSTCTSTSTDELFAQVAIDKDERGKDNAGLGLVAYLSSLSSAFRASEITDRLRKGEFGLVIRVSQWNGTAEDRSVFVEIFPAFGRKRGAAEADAGPFAASDRWQLDTRFTISSDPKTEPTSKINAVGWVTGGVLVAPLGSATVGVSVPDDDKPFDIVLRDTVATASVVPAEAGGYRLRDVVVGGRWSTRDLLGQVRTIYLKDSQGFKDKYLCEPPASGIYDLVKARLCEGRDIRSVASEDGKGLGCDAISTAVRIDTYPVLAVGDYREIQATPRCIPDAGRDVVVASDDDCRAVP